MSWTLLSKAAAALALTASAALSQPVAPGPKFEVASIKPSEDPRSARLAGHPLRGGTRIDGAMVDIASASLSLLIKTAYRVEAYQVTGPDWMATQRFDILAKIPEGATKDQVPEMLQALLAERFGLVARRETKEQPVYALLLGKDGIKIKETPSDAVPSDRPFPNGTGGRILLYIGRMEKGWQTTSKLNDVLVFDAQRMSMPELALKLMTYVNLPVVDMTALKADYQIVAMPVPGTAAQAAGRGGAGGVGDIPDQASDPSGVSIFKSVEKLGLKLEKRIAPITHIVVDRLDKNPTEN